MTLWLWFWGREYLLNFKKGLNLIHIFYKIKIEDLIYYKAYSNFGRSKILVIKNKGRGL